ncbi:MAG TPA: carboxypeptidase regulatory-like domain-containing protein [Bryobacteraceae bacterium]|nr:carboxypeptidase regulatory-like domain-containing protein [Bryobacteraceae bacterium]
MPEFFDLIPSYGKETIMREYRYLPALFIFAALWLAFAGLKLNAAETTGTIAGVIVDSSGAVVPDVKIRITNESTGRQRETVSDGVGSFAFPLVDIGPYRATAEKSGFRNFVQSGLVVRVNDRITLNIRMEVGSMEQQVTVTGQGSLVNTQTAEIRSLVDRVRIEKLPLNGRNVLQLTLLTGGVLDSGGGTANQGFIHANAKIFPSASGGRADAMNFIFDGGTNNDRYTNVAMPLPNPDAVQEFSFLTNSFSAEYGAASGGVVNVVSKTGTNELHGTAYNYLRNSKLNATNFFTPGVSDRLKRNQAGFSVGGPVWLPRIYDGRNKTFFFLSFQETFLRQSPVSANQRTLTADELKGDFSLQASLLRRPVLDPATGTDRSNRTPFPNNQVPIDRLDPIMLKISTLLPVGDPATGFITSATARTMNNQPEWLARGDHNVSSANRLSFRYFRSLFSPILSVEETNPYLTGNSGIRQFSQSFTLGDSHIFTPRLLANVNVTVSRIHNAETYMYPGLANNNPAALGIMGFPNGSFFLRSPFVAVGYAGPYTTLASTNFQYQGSMTYIVGRHEIKFGAQYMRSQLNQQRLALGGNWFFGTDYTDIPQSDFLMGLPNSFSAFGTFGEALRQNRFDTYVQDNIRLSRRLSVSVGIRFDPFFPWAETNYDKVSLFRPGLKSQRFPNLPVGAVVAGDPGVPEHGYPGDHNNFAPRVGFAFDPRGNGRTAIRGAAGFFFGQPGSASINQRSQVNFPFVTRADITSPGSLGPGAVANVFRTGTKDEIPNPFLTTIGVPPKEFPIPTPLLYTSTADNYGLPYTAQWNFSVEQQFGPDWTTTATYMGSKSTHLLMAYERNPSIYIPGNGPDGRPLSTSANIDQRRPYGPAFTSVQELASDGNANYNALVLRVRKAVNGVHWWSRSTFEVNHTWSHTLDVLSDVVSPGGSSPRNPFNARLDYGNSNFDHRHRFVASYVWALPPLTTMPTAVRAVLGNWNTSSVMTFQDGNVFSLTGGLSQPFTTGDPATQAGADATLPSGRSKQERILRWFNTDAFRPTPVGAYGNTGRNILRGPGFANVDFSVYKNLPLPGDVEGRYIEFRSEFFNLFNRVNLGMPNSNASNAFFGRILSAGSPRIVQFAVKLYF